MPQCERMKRLPGLLGALALIAGCAGGLTEPATTVPLTTTPTSPVTTVPSTTTTSPPAGPPVAWITPSGVPVAVTGVNGERITILTPCGNPGTVVAGTAVHQVDVVIDPGHGGPIDTGAVAPTGLAEKDINLRVGMAVHDLLVERGIATILTRVGDYAVPIRTRSEYSDLVGAKALVSIHHNAPVAPPSDVPGVEVFVRHQTRESARLGGLVYDETMAALEGFDVDWDRAPDAGVMTVLNDEGVDAYGMVRLPEAPSILVELGYIANRAEAELFAHPGYVPTVAGAVADAIEKFLETDESGASLVEGRNFNAQRGVGSDVCVEADLVDPLYPDVVEATVAPDGAGFRFTTTLRARYAGPERYPDAWRVIGDDGVVYAVYERDDGHPVSELFSGSLESVVIPLSVSSVTVEGRDLVYGWGGESVRLTLPGKRRPTFS